MDFPFHPGLMFRVFGLGFWEIAFILGAALLVFGPQKLPELARTLGRGLREFRNATDDFKNTIDAELHDNPPPRSTKPEPEQLPETVAQTKPTGAELKADPPEPAVEAKIEEASPAPEVETTKADPTPEKKV